MPVPKELVDLLLSSTVPVFVKTDNYVPAHIGLVPGDRTIGGSWSEERMTKYLFDEANLNNKGGWLPGNRIMIYLGDAKYHSWVRAYRVTLTDDAADYNWERMN